MSYLTPKEVAAELKVSVRSIHRLIERGELPAFRVGGLIRISQRAFNAWVVDREQSITDWQAARETGNQPRQRQASAPAIATVARPAALLVGPLPADYARVFGDKGELLAASPAAARGRSTKGKKKAV